MPWRGRRSRGRRPPTQEFIRAQNIVAIFAFTTPLNSLPSPPVHEIPDFLVRYNFVVGLFGVGLFFLVSGSLTA